MAQIIPKNLIAVENNWQKDLASCFTDPESLLRYLDLDPEDYQPHVKARRLFPMRVPRPFAARIAKSTPDDPLLRQVFPMSDEFTQIDGYVKDPLVEQSAAKPGVLHKYQSRVLLIVKGGCAVNCRYCFRRHFPYGENSVNKAGWQQALDYVSANKDINEVIFSGGDPLMAKDNLLAWLSEQISAISHIKRLRIHTRLPVVIPSRVNSEMLAWFAGTRLKPIMVLHVNHPNEVDADVKAMCQRLQKAGVTLLNQAVLLKGVNDNVNTLCALSETLFDASVLPYYLHLLDKVEGAAHFDVEETHARVLMAEVIKRLPGFLVPKLVREIADQPGKTPVDLHLQP